MEQTAENRYRLAFKIVQIGTRITERFEIRQRARSLMTELSQAPAYCTALGKAALKYCGNTSDFLRTYT